jgi:exodeoxyribonuclease VII small subunit
MAKARETTLKFEDALEQVESIIEQIESGQVGLEESIAQYEQGMKLLSRCQTILSSAQKRIAELTTDSQGRLRASDEAGESDHPVDPDSIDESELSDDEEESL